MPIILAVANQKGGVGKSTLALNLADYYGREGSRVAIVDKDLQNGITDYVASFKERGDKLHYELIPASFIDSYRDILKLKHYDLVIIDTPPIVTQSLPDLYEVSDIILLPIKPSSDDLASLNRSIAYLKQIKTQKPEICITAVLNMVQSQGSSINKSFREYLEGMGLGLLNTEIMSRVVYQRYRLAYSSIFQTKDKKAQVEISSLGEEVMALAQKIFNQ